jgi:hypothetical protein
MHNLKTSFNKFFDITKSVFKDRINKSEDVYLVDSIPVPVCQIARVKRSKIFKWSFETAPDIGYSA